MPGPKASRKRKGRRGPCSYCGKTHKKGQKRGDSCGGHTPIKSVEKRPPTDVGQISVKKEEEK